MEGSEVAHHLFVYFLLVCVDRLSVLAEVVESGEMLSTMAIERTLPGMLSGQNGEVRTCSGYKMGEEQYLMCLAKCSLRLKTIRQSP